VRYAILLDMADPTPASALPLFYRRPQALDPNKHGQLRLTPGGYGFARRANAVALLAPEFPQAARLCPIVFTTGANALPAAVLGLRTDDNLFVDEHGQWERATYIPAYVRRYPFIFFEQPNGGRLTLCIDEAAEQLSTDTGRPLFDGQHPSETTRQALELCSAFQRDAAVTRSFVEALEAKELLVDRRADVALDRGDRMALAGFRVIDEARFNALDDATILDWRKRGWLGLVYCHLLSSGAWGGLVERAAKRAAPA
jgi:hypothetical protein